MNSYTIAYTLFGVFIECDACGEDTPASPAVIKEAERWMNQHGSKCPKAKLGPVLPDDC